RRAGDGSTTALPGGGGTLPRNGRLRFGRLEIALAAREGIVDGTPVRTTAREFDLLRLFVAHPRHGFSREHPFELIWGSYGARSAAVVSTSGLRGKFDAAPGRPRLIVTVWGAGCRFDGERL